MTESSRAPLRIAFVGTRGVSARSGGVESCVEELGARLADRGHRVVVYCVRSNRSAAPARATYRGMTLVQQGGTGSAFRSHTGRSVAHLALHRADVAIVFRPINAPWLPLLRALRIPFATEVDGLEWQRARWGYFGRLYCRATERFSASWSPALVADSIAMQQYYLQKYDAPSDVIPFTATQITTVATDRIAGIGLERCGYHLVDADFRLENNLHLIVDGYSRSSAKQELVVVGPVDPADPYTRAVHALAGDRVRFLDDVRDPELLDQLYANASSYLHGHSVGGTSPSLLRAIAAGRPVTAFDVRFNREVLGKAGRYFTSAEDVCRLVEETEDDDSVARERGERLAERAAQYDWDDVADRYEALCRRIVERRRSQDNKSVANAGGPSGSTERSAPHGMPNNQQGEAL